MEIIKSSHCGCVTNNINLFKCAYLTFVFFEGKSWFRGESKPIGVVMYVYINTYRGSYKYL